MKTFKRGGIHPNPNKITAGRGIDSMIVPQFLVISMSQSLGTPAKCLVKPGQEVRRGEMIGEPGGFVSAAVHSPVDGIVRKVEPVRDAQGLWTPGVIIERSEQQMPENFHHREKEEIDLLTPKDIIDEVRNAGIVGAGGATFPTHVKLSVPEGRKVEYVILNGAECEPYLTCDDALMQSHAEDILQGMVLIMKAVGAEKGVVGIESNKPEAIRAMKSAAVVFPSIKIEKLKTAYPQGSEKQLIYSLTKRIVPAGGLPLDCGVIVDNVATAYCIRQAIYEGIPMMERLVTVTGPDLSSPGNYNVMIGTPLSMMIEECGGAPEDTGKIIAGGPMMGRAVSNPDACSTKGLSGVLVLPERESRRGKALQCLRCASCVSVCPMGLEPYLLMTFGERNMDEEAKKHGVMNCLECGSCSYICPSVRPILDYVRHSKRRLRIRKV